MAISPHLHLLRITQQISADQLNRLSVSFIALEYAYSVTQASTTQTTYSCQNKLTKENCLPLQHVISDFGPQQVEARASQA